MIRKSLFLSIRLVSTIQKSPHLYGRLQLSWLVPAEVSPPASHVSLTNTLPGAGALDPGTERSIPPEMITNVIPIDSTAFTEPCNPTVNVRVGDQQTVDEPANGTSRNHLERAAKKAQHNEEFGYDAAHGEYPLTAGMVLSIETGIKHPEAGFIKLEDTVVVTETGWEAYRDWGRDWNEVTF